MFFIMMVTQDPVYNSILNLYLIRGLVNLVRMVSLVRMVIWSEWHFGLWIVGVWSMAVELWQQYEYHYYYQYYDDDNNDDENLVVHTIKNDEANSVKNLNFNSLEKQYEVNVVC